ncbi:MAG: YkgJ family cysteine cluster protein [Candidatus Lokiarchaeota archaeon]|nr:YkgJ family cysteine cluster protein [Candidatus Lokiarchaeota archaeon]
MEQRIELANNLNVLRFTCTKCGKCCKDPNTFINVTYHDILRLRKGLKLSLEEILEVIGFYTFSKVNIEKFMSQMVYAPIQTEQGLAFIGLLKKQDSRCTFLGEDDTCTIYEHRPAICRTFPFTFLMSEDGKKITNKIGYTKKGIDYCPGIKKTAPIVKKKKIGIKLTTSLAEIASDAKMVESWNKMVENKQIQPKAAKYIASILLMEDKLKEEKSHN